MTWIFEELSVLFIFFMQQFKILFPYWIIGLTLSAFLTAYGEKTIEKAAAGMGKGRFPLFYLLPACILGVVSPLCMYGTVPLIAMLARKGIPQSILVGFMISSILLNPTLFTMSLSLGIPIALMRLVQSLLCGFIAGILVHFLWNKKPVFQLGSFTAEEKPVTRTRWHQFLHSLRRNFEITAPYFLFGITLTILFQRYIPTDIFTKILGDKSPFAILASASIGIPLYMCGGGTIPLIRSWIDAGMSIGAASSFMISGPATKLNNLSAVKMILGKSNFILYLIYTLSFSVLAGYAVNMLF
ncbi:MAG: permease [Clostridia bacterium]|nr:permease [Clostridia bacterium]